MINRMILNQTSYFGKGAITALPEEIQKRHFQKALIITDQTLLETGLVTQVTTLLTQHEIAYALFADIVPNPTIADIQAGVQFCQESAADCLIALGGGSPIDAAKAIGMICTNPEFSDVRSLEGVANTQNPALPIFAVPTTSGTAAEVTINYVITDPEKQRKFVCVDPHDIPIVAFVDSDMMQNMPKPLAAATGMDALTHAIEGYLTQNAWTMTDMFHLEAIRVIGHALRDSVNGDQSSREQMALGQYLAGMGFSNVGLGLVHGMAHPLSARYNIPHGVACATLLPTVMAYNQTYTGEKYRKIGEALGLSFSANETIEAIREQTIAAVQHLGEDVGIPQTITSLGVKEADLLTLAQDALNDVCTPGNPREATLADICQLYQSLL